jgi:hypothetical protein
LSSNEDGLTTRSRPAFAMTTEMYGSTRAPMIITQRIQPLSTMANTKHTVRMLIEMR